MKQLLERGCLFASPNMFSISTGLCTPSVSPMLESRTPLRWLGVQLSPRFMGIDLNISCITDIGGSLKRCTVLSYFGRSDDLQILNVPEQKPINILAVVAGLSVAQMEMKREGINNEVLDDVVPLAWEAPLAACAAANSVGRREALKRPIANSAGRRGVTLRRPIARMQAQFKDIAGLNT